MAELNTTNTALTLEDIRSSQWKEIIGQAKRKDCFDYNSLFMAASSKAEKDGDRRKQAVYRLLGDITSLHMKSNDTKEPFGPMVVMNGKRSAIPADFADDQLAVLQEFLPEIEDPELRSRIADVVWLRKRDYKAAEMAIDGYIESAKALEDPDHWTYTFNRIERAFRLAVTLGTATGNVDKIASHIESVLDRYKGEDPLYLSEKLMSLLCERKMGDSIKFGKLAEKAALRAEAAHDWHRAQTYWQRKAEWDRIAKNQESRKASLIKAAETYVQLAEASANGDRASFMAASSHLTKAIEAYRRIGGMNQRIDELHKLLLEYQKKSLKEFGVISSPPIDLTNAINQARDSVKEKSLLDAIYHLCTNFRIESVTDLRKRVEESAKNFPLMHFMTSVIVNEKGKVIGKKAGLLLDEKGEYENALRPHMFHEATLGYSIDVQALIDPMRRQIMLDHEARLDDLGPIVLNNPLIPEGREYIYAQGLLAGLQADFLTSTHLLVPQFENSMRYILEQQGIPASKIDADGIQEEYDLNVLLYHDKIKKLFQEDLIFHLQALLVESEGCNIRNRMAHGLMSHQEFYAPYTMYLWALILRLCCWPAIVKLHQKTSSTRTESAMQSATDTNETSDRKPG